MVRPLSQHNAMQDLLEHFRAKGQRPKITLCLFYDVSVFEEDLTFTPMLETRLRPSLAPNERSIVKFVNENVEPYPDTCEFEIIVHAAAVPEEGKGPHRPHEVMVYFACTDNPDYSNENDVEGRFNCSMRIYLPALHRLGAVSYPEMEDPKDLAWWDAFRQIYAKVRGVKEAVSESTA